MSAQGATVVAQSGVCRWCRGPLKGGQTAYCSKACNAAWWDAAHPRVNWTPEGPREGRLLDLILGFLQAHPGEWFTKHQIGEAVRAFPHSVGSRLSELRLKGHAIEADTRNGNSKRAHRFRLSEAQGPLTDAPLSIEEARQAADEVADELKNL